MKYDAVNEIAKREVVEFVFNECDYSYDELAVILERGDDLPEDVMLWSVFDEYEYAPVSLLNFMEGIRHTLLDFGSKIAGYKL